MRGPPAEKSDKTAEDNSALGSSTDAANPTEPSVKQTIAKYTYRTLTWGKNSVPPGIRSVLGVLFMIGGVFGILPILGFWMFPLGMAFIALDIPPARHKVENWLVSLQKTAYPITQNASAAVEDANLHAEGQSAESAENKNPQD